MPRWSVCRPRGDGRSGRRADSSILRSGNWGAFAVSDALRAGDLYLADNRHHVSFWNLVYDETRWQEERHQAYVTLDLPNNPDRTLDRLYTEFTQVATAVALSLAQNPFATIVDGRLHLKHRDALEVSAPVRPLQQVMDTHLPWVRSEDMLHEVDSWCRFALALRPLVGVTPLATRFYPTLLAALVAHGTNLGIALMGERTDGITVDMLHEVSHACLRTDTLKAANKALVDYHHGLALRAVWGDGTVSSSDGQRFGDVFATHAIAGPCPGRNGSHVSGEDDPFP
jgi:Tn3 transposase DDE domain-containing protein